MRKSHFALFAVAIATVGYVAAAPGQAAVQEENGMMSMPTDPELTSAQMAERDSWPAEQQASYEAWPAETKSYYWLLTPERQALFWRLSDDDKIAITAMTGPEREAAWTQIEAATMAPSPEG